MALGKFREVRDYILRTVGVCVWLVMVVLDAVGRVRTALYCKYSQMVKINREPYTAARLICIAWAR